MSIAFFPLLILAVLVLGGVAAVAYLFVHAIVNKKPGAALTVVLGLLALLLGIPLFLVGASYSVPVLHEIKAQSMDTASGGTYTVVQHSHGRLAMISWPVIVVLVVGGIWVVSRIRRSHRYGEGRGGWGLPLLAVMALLLAGWYYLRMPREQAAEQQHRVFSHAAQQQAMTRLRDQATALVQGPQQSVDQLWEQMNRPRIEFVPPPSPQVDPPSPPAPSPTLSDTHSQTDELLAKLVTHVDALARHFATIAEALAESRTSARESSRTQEAETAASTTVSLETPSDGQDTGASPTSRHRPPGAADTAWAVEAERTDDVATELAVGSTDTSASGSATPQTPAKPRPPWVDDPPRRIGNIWREVVVAGEYETVEECYRAADIYLLFATYDHLMRLTDVPQVSSQTRPSLHFQQDNVLANGQYLVVNGYPQDYRLNRLASVGIGIDYVRREIAKDEYVETAERSVGPMKTLYTLVEFSPAVDRELRRRWETYQREERFAMVGAGAAMVLGLLGAVYGLLKIDTWTKGYYTKRLFLGVPAVIIGLVALLALIVG